MEENYECDSKEKTLEKISNPSKRTKKYHKKEKRKHRKRSRRSRSTSSNNSDTNSCKEEEWIEKTIEKHDTTAEAMEKAHTREEWMNLNNILQCVSQSDKKKMSDTIKKEVKKVDLDTPGQSSKELNPYWKNGGTGLPNIKGENPGLVQTIDVNWMKKSLQRAKEQAIEEGKSLEEIAAARWGSLQTLQSMIRKAERKSLNDEQNYRRNKNRECHMRSRDRSHTRHGSTDYDNKYSKTRDSYSSQARMSYKKPIEEDDFFLRTSLKSSLHRTHSRNMSKESHSDSRHVSISNNDKLEENTKRNVDADNKIKIEEDVITTKPSISAGSVSMALTEAEMNKLGSRIIKAEIMGDEKLAAELKFQLEEARKLGVCASKRIEEAEETVLLSRTDAKGISRPIQPRSGYTNTAGNKKKKRIVETHNAGQRSRYYEDDDKYSLQQLFVQEKSKSVNDDDAAFHQTMAKNADMSDIFEQQIAQAGSSNKYDHHERALAIKEHQKISKGMNNCNWCIDSNHMQKHMIIMMDSDICLSLPAYTSLTTGHCILTPVQHISCQLQLDEDIWDKIKMAKNILSKMFMDKCQYPVFFEVYKKTQRFSHMQVICIPVDKEIGNLVPMYFKKALLECETEWAINKKVIDLHKKDLRNAIPRGLSYFVVEFGVHSGFAHIIEDDHMFPKSFAQEIIAGMLDMHHDVWRKPRKEDFAAQTKKVMEFTKLWEEYDTVFSK